jgi:hypothetical protein
MDELFEYVESLPFSGYASLAQDLDHLFDILESDPVFPRFVELDNDVENKIMERLLRFEHHQACEGFNPFDPTLVFYLKVLAERHSLEIQRAAVCVSSFRCSRFAKSFACQLLVGASQDEP